MGRALDFRRQDISLAVLEQEIATNLTGTAWVTSQFLPLLLQKKDAAVVMISSALAIAPLPALPVYSATKAAVHSFAIALRYQLRETPVKVFDILPTWVDTGLTDGLPAAKITPDVVARAILDGLRTDKKEIYVGRGKALHRINRISPALAQRLTINSMRPDRNEPTRSNTKPGDVQLHGNGGR
jgi:uncharacterized oxidoreductase